MPERSEFRYFQQIPTRWSDLDVIGHINNARYFSYDEQVRIDYMHDRIRSALGKGRGSHFILAHIACDFLAQVHHPATLDVGLRIAKLGGSSVHTRSGVFDKGRCVAALSGVIVWFDYKENQKARVPDQLRKEIWEYEVVKPEE